MNSSESDDFQPSEEIEAADASAAEEKRRTKSLGISTSNSEGDTEGATKLQDPGLQHQARNKRKHAHFFWQTATAQRSAKRLRALYSPGYHDLFNQIVEEATSVIDPVPKRYKWPDEQYGLVSWSAEEKDRFFNALDRKGRYNVEAIASSIGTKSQPEVQAFIQLLNQDVLDEDPKERYRLVEYPDIPAAYEVSEECRRALEDSADALAQKQFEYEVDVERRRHGNFWLLDLNTVKELKILRAGKEENQNEATSTSALETAFDLLDLKAMIELSFRLFMNSKDFKYNWQRYAEAGHGPSLFCTAFLDIHNLVIGITKRLVASSLFMTLSRLRVLKESGKLPKPEVRIKDVHAALDTMKFNHDAFEYWRGIARRCNLRVYDSPEVARASETEIALSDVERRLGEPLRRDSSLARSAPSEDSEDSEISSESLFSQDPPPKLSANEPQLERLDKHQEAEEEYAEFQDTKESWDEELRLWDLLQAKPRSERPPTTEMSPLKPRSSRQSRQRSDDWRERITYKSEWQVYEEPPAQKSFEKNRQLKRRERNLSELSTSPPSTVEEQETSSTSVGEHSSFESGEDEYSQAANLRLYPCKDGAIHDGLAESGGEIAGQDSEDYRLDRRNADTQRQEPFEASASDESASDGRSDSGKEVKVD
ncbi:MAG: hypothetical protein LQ340_000625 [Diploschistes diacapsis]|nr:MAG: hypothetical protein LQ340_000625 [Diploschistes diacapsis]